MEVSDLMFVRSLLFAHLCMCVTVLLTSCYQENKGLSNAQINEKTNYAARENDVKHQKERSYQTQQIYGSVTHDAKELGYSSFLSNEVSKVHGVNTAIVLMTDQHAYVAIIIDNSISGTKGKQRETNNRGTIVGMYDTRTPYSDGIPPGDLHSGANNQETSIHHDFLTHQFKQSIAEKIRVLQPSIKDVFISANRDFINSMNRYWIEHTTTHSLHSYIPEFNQLVNRVFGNDQTLFDQ